MCPLKFRTAAHDSAVPVWLACLLGGQNTLIEQSVEHLMTIEQLATVALAFNYHYHTFHVAT